MQKLLSRALEARSSCHCAFCATSRPGLARKVNTLPVRQRIKFGDVVTIVYGTVLGTAAFYNGTSKKRRREALNNAIDEVVLENRALLENQEARLRALGYAASAIEPPSDSLLSNESRASSQTSILQTDRRPSISLPSLSPTQQSHFRHSSSAAQLVAEEDVPSSWDGVPMKKPSSLLQRVYSKDPKRRADTADATNRPAKFVESIFPEERVIGKTIDEAWTDITLIPNEHNTRIREIAVFRLVLRLLELYLNGVDTTAESDPRISFTAPDGEKIDLGLKDIPDLLEKHQDLNHNIESIKTQVWNSEQKSASGSIHYPLYQIYDRNEGSSSRYHSDVRIQAEQLVRIFSEAQNAKDLISNVCTLLVSSKCAPDIHVINLLLIHFLDLEWFAAAKSVVLATRELAMNQNEITDLAKLRYFHTIKDHVKFDAQRTHMLGADGRTTRAAYKPGELIPDEWVQEQLVEQIRDRNGVPTVTYGLKAGWTAEAFSVVVIDLLDRGNLSSALAEIATMRISGLRETPEVLTALLQYGAFKRDWDVAAKTWARYEALDRLDSPLIWYWMLQACAACNQSQAFDTVSAAGQREGFLDSSIDYKISNFTLEREDRRRLKRVVKATRRLQERIRIPDLSHRDIHLHSQDLIQLSNLQQTLMVVHLQYTELRAANSTWAFNAPGRLRQVEEGLEHLMLLLKDDPAMMKKFLDCWNGYTTKVEAIAAVCNDSYMNDCSVPLQEAIERMALSSTSDIQHDQELDQLRAAFMEKPPASVYFQTMLSRLDTILSRKRSHLGRERSPVMIAKTQTMTRRDWDQYEWWIGSNVLRQMVRSSSRYALTRYWDKVLHPDSPANLIPTAMLKKDEKTVRIQTNSTVAETASLASQGIGTKSIELERKTKSSKYALRKATKETTALKSRLDQHRKDEVVISSPQTTPEAGQRTSIPTSLSIAKEHDTVHAPWQSVSTAPSSAKKEHHKGKDHTSNGQLDLGFEIESGITWSDRQMAL